MSSSTKGSDFDSDFIPIFLVEEGRLSKANDEMHRVLRYEPGELIGRPALEVLLARQSGDAAQGGFRHAIQTGKAFSGSVELQRKDGSTGWYDFHASPRSESPGVLIGALIDRTAETERVRDLKAKEAQYRSVVEDQTEIIGRFLPDGTLLFVNEVYCRTFGFSAEALIGRPWQPVAHPDDVAMVVARLKEMTPQNPVVVVENRVFTASGETLWMQFVNRGFYDSTGRLMEIQAVGRDISALKEVERQLRESDELLELALEGSNLVLLDWNIREGTLVAGKRLVNQIGYHTEELGSDRDNWMALIHPDDRTMFDEKVSAHLRGETPTFECEYRVRHKSGHWVVVEARGKVNLRDRQGAPIRMVGTVLDVTQRKRLHDEGVQLLKRIESLIHTAASGNAERIDAAKSVDALTKRERQIMGMIAAGMTSSQIGATLSLSTPTVVTHRRNLMAKLDLHSTAEVTRFALENGLLPTG